MCPFAFDSGRFVFEVSFHVSGFAFLVAFKTSQPQYAHNFRKYRADYHTFEASQPCGNAESRRGKSLAVHSPFHHAPNITLTCSFAYA